MPFRIYFPHKLFKMLTVLTFSLYYPVQGVLNRDPADRKADEQEVKGNSHEERDMYELPYTIEGVKSS